MYCKCIGTGGGGNIIHVSVIHICLDYGWEVIGSQKLIATVSLLTGGIEYYNDCRPEPVTAFWEEFSIQFATVAEGTVYWLTLGNAGMAYHNNSFWATAEIPNLMPPRVSEVVVLDVHEKQVGEACGEGSLVTLDEILDMRGFNHRCYNVYGNPMTEPSALSNCTLHIIAAIQQGR